MPTPYNGLASNVVNYQARSISGASSASPISITTTTPHGFTTGDQVSIFAVGGNTLANSKVNRPWTITVTGATTFTLNGSRWSSGAYAGGGQVHNLSLTPTPNTLSGYDPVLAVNSPIEALLDRSQYLGQRQPSAALIGQYTSVATAGFVTPWAQIASMPVAATWTDLATGLFGPGTTPTSFSGSPFNGNDYSYDYGDILDVCLTTTLATSTANVQPALQLTLKDDTGASYVGIPGSPQMYTIPSFSGLFSASAGVSLRGVYQNAVGGAAASVDGSLGSGIWQVSGLTNMSAACVGDWLRLVDIGVPGNTGIWEIVAFNNANQVQIYKPAGGLSGAFDVIWGLYGSSFNFGVQAQSGLGVDVELRGSSTVLVNHYRPVLDPFNNL